MTSTADLVAVATELRDSEVSVHLIRLDLHGTSLNVAAHRDIAEPARVVTDEVEGGSHANVHRRTVSIVAEIRGNDPALAAETADWLRGVLERWRHGAAP